MNKVHVSVLFIFSLILPLVSGASMQAKYFVPEGVSDQQALPLVVVLHGCLQGADEIAASTRFDELAQQEKFAVLYPEQSRQANINRCFNWFRPQDQRRSGEPEAIVELVNQFNQFQKINKRRVYVTGFSAGAGMAAILATCYADTFAGVAIHSGTTYLAAQSMLEAFTAMRQGSQVPPEEGAAEGYACVNKTGLKPIDTMVIHGMSDTVVTPRFREQLVEQFTAFNDYLDDGSRNNSFRERDNSIDEGSSEGGYNYRLTVRDFGGTRLADLAVEQLGHAWSGGSQMQYSDPRGPNATLSIWRFFQGSRK